MAGEGLILLTSAVTVVVTLLVVLMVLCFALVLFWACLSRISKSREKYQEQLDKITSEMEEMLRKTEEESSGDKSG
jgi:uncharacterized protein YoxC